MLIIFYLIISASAHAAGGIALGATRIIYPADAKQTAVWIRNSHTNERFLVNSWIENSSGVKEKSFIITPPLFVSEPKSENTLRIIYTGPPLAADRESLFWMNVKTIPSVDKNALNGRNVLPLLDTAPTKPIRALMILSPCIFLQTSIFQMPAFRTDNPVYSKISPSMEMVTTCQGRNFPLSCIAFFAAISSPPQQGTSMRTMVTD